MDITWQEFCDRWADPAYVVRVEKLATALKADGCSGVPDFYLLGCLEHDIAYRTHCDAYGYPTTKRRADKHLRWYIQMRSPFDGFSPMAWWRWQAVKWWGKKAWTHKPEPFPEV